MRPVAARAALFYLLQIANLKKKVNTSKLIGYFNLSLAFTFALQLAMEKIPFTEK